MTDQESRILTTILGRVETNATGNNGPLTLVWAQAYAAIAGTIRVSVPIGTAKVDGQTEQA